MKANSSNPSKMYLRLTLIALSIRLIYLFSHILSPFFAQPFLDQRYYDLCARQLAGAGGNLIDGFRPLLYPFFLSIFYTLDLEDGIILSILAQHTLGVCITLMVAWLALRIFDSIKAGLIAGLLFCFSAPPLYFEGELLIATLFSFLLLGTWMAVFKAMESSRIRSASAFWLVSGIVLGLAAQARPNAIPLLLFFPMLSIFRLIKDRQQLLRGTMPMLAVVGILAIQVIFGALNAKYSGHFALMTQAGGINFYLGNSQKADGMIPRQNKHVVYTGEYRDPIQVMAEQGYREDTGITGKISAKEISSHWKEKTLDEIHEDPARWIGLMAKKAWLMIWNHEVPNNRSFSFAANEETPILRWLPVRWWLLLTLLPWGLAALIKKQHYEFLLWVLSFLLLFSGTVVLFFVNSRFRIPLWPGLAILGGGGITYLGSSLKSRSFPLFPIIFSGALVLLSTINWFGIPPDPIENDLSMRASAYYDQGRYEEALPDVLQCIETAPNNPRYHFLLGNILLAQENAEIAIQAYLKALSLDASDPMFHNNLGIAFEEIGEPKKAMTAYRQALELRPNHRAAQINLLLLAIQTDQLAQAKIILEQIPADSRNNSTLQCAQLILHYKESGDQTFRTRAEEINKPLADQLTRSE